MTINNSIYRTPRVELLTIFGYSFHAEWSGSGISVDMVIQGSNVESPAEATDTDWVDIIGSDLTSAGADKTLMNVTDVMYRWTRFKITETNTQDALVKVWFVEKGT